MTGTTSRRQLSLLITTDNSGYRRCQSSTASVGLYSVDGLHAAQQPHRRLTVAGSLRRSRSGRTNMQLQGPLEQDRIAVPVMVFFGHHDSVSWPCSVRTSTAHPVRRPLRITRRMNRCPYNVAAGFWIKDAAPASVPTEKFGEGSPLLAGVPEDGHCKIDRNHIG